MPFCANCGASVEGQFCGTCGQAVGAAPSGAAPPPPSTPAVAPAAAGLTDNVAGLLCYIAGFITGILFLVMAPYNQNKFIRFHAFQSIFLCVAWVGLMIVERIIDVILLSVSVALLAMVAMLWIVVALAVFALWIVLMVKAYQGQRWKLPIIGDLAEKQA
jgi:uncharacterized membrane protein